MPSRLEELRDKYIRVLALDPLPFRCLCEQGYGESGFCGVRYASELGATLDGTDCEFAPRAEYAQVRSLYE